MPNIGFDGIILMLAHGGTGSCKRQGGQTLDAEAFDKDAAVTSTVDCFLGRSDKVVIRIAGVLDADGTNGVKVTVLASIRDALNPDVFSPAVIPTQRGDDPSTIAADQTILPAELTDGASGTRDVLLYTTAAVLSGSLTITVLALDDSTDGEKLYVRVTG